MKEFAGSQWERAERITVAFELYTDVALTRDMSEVGLRRGDVVKFVDHHVAPDGEESSELWSCACEFFDVLPSFVA